MLSCIGTILHMLRKHAREHSRKASLLCNVTRCPVAALRTIVGRRTGIAGGGGAPGGYAAPAPLSVASQLPVCGDFIIDAACAMAVLRGADVFCTLGPMLSYSFSWPQVG